MLDVPYLPQAPELCGGAAAAMVMRYWGGTEAEARSFAHLVRPVAGGIRTDELAAELRSRGWRAHRVGPEPAAVRRHVRAGRPVILLLRVDPGRFHFVVAVAAPGGEWLIHDPARAPFLRLSGEELAARWSPAGRWGLLLLPPEADGQRPEDPADGNGDGDGDGRRCRDEVRRGVAAARGGSEARSDSLLRRAARRCPGAAAPRRELAGLRFRQERWGRAAGRAEEALARAPGDSLAARILASARFMAGRERQALAAWNRLGEPRLSAVRVYGLRRTRYRPLRRQMALEAGELLSPGDPALARRRVGAVPAFASSRVDLRPPEAGRAELEVAVVERPLLPTSAPGVAATALRGLVERELRVTASSPTGSGGAATASWRWWSGRPRVRLRLRTPAAIGVPGVWTATAGWERPTFGGVSVEDGPRLREERRGGALALSRWVGPGLRLEAGAGLDRWSGLGTRVRLIGEVGARALGDRLAARLSLGGWTGEGRDFGRAALDAAARTPATRDRARGPARGPGLRVAVSLAAADGAGPRSLWPGAGTGHARRPLLRAHPLLRDGVIRGPAFGPRLAQASLEARWTLGAGLPVELAPAAFLDAAGASGGGPGRRDRRLLDAGVGLRVGLPGVGGELRADLAWGLSDGARALSAGWRPPWPGW